MLTSLAISDPSWIPVHGTGIAVLGWLSLKESELALPNHAKSRNREINSKSCQMAHKFDRRLRSDTAETPFEFRSHPKNLNTNLAASRLDGIWESELALL